MDCMCQKRSLDDEIVPQDNCGTRGLDEHNTSSVLDNFTWERGLDRRSQLQVQGPQDFTHTANTACETVTPSTKRLVQSWPFAFEQKLGAKYPDELSRHTAIKDSTTEPAYRFMLDTDVLFELGERPQHREKDSSQSEPEQENSNESDPNQPAHQKEFDESFSDQARARIADPIILGLNKHDPISANRELAGPGSVTTKSSSNKADDENARQTTGAVSSPKPASSSVEPLVGPSASFDPTIDPGDFSFAADRTSEKDIHNTWRPPAESLATESGSRSRFPYIERFSTKQILVPLIAIVAGVVLLYPSSPKPYSVETRLFFVTLDGKSPERAGWSVDREAKYFNNTNILYACAQKFFGAHQDANGAQGVNKHKASNPIAQSGPRTIADGRERIKSSGDFIKWFIKSSSLEADSSSVPSRITFRLAGHDPAFLKAVSESYVRSYVDFRRTAQTTDSLESKIDPRTGQQNPEDSSVKPMSDRMRNFEIQEREYELALRLLDSGKSPFSGFIPKESMVDPGSLVNFQQKIVQLEINKNSLLTRFAPESREVRSVEEEIQSVREAMRQCVIEQLRFVKQNKEMLQAQKSGPEKASLEAVEPKSSGSSPIAGGRGSMNRDQPIFIADGLYLLWDTASVVDKPFLAGVGDFFRDRMLGNVHRSVDNMKGLKDSVVTGIYHSLVSDDGFRSEAAPSSDLEDAPLETAPVKRFQNGR